MPARAANSRTPIDLRGKIAVITGGSRGIGLAIANALANAGCKLAIGARLQSDGASERLQQRFGALVQTCDVRDQLSVEEFFATVKRRFARIDILVNNAGVGGASGNVAFLSADEWRNVIETNLTGMFLCTRAALPLMKRGASIVNNLSVSAKRIFPGMSAYNASKHGGAGFTDTLREELREQGIRVIGLYPGATNTNIWEQFWPGAPRKKMMKPETVAQAVVFTLGLPPEAAVEELVIAPTSGAL